MRRIRLTLSYDGTAYAGWQRQKNGLAVQQVVEECLERATGVPVRITGASRTDAGVHALGQACHFDTESGIPPEKYPYVLNTMLPGDIRCLEGVQVDADFSARFHTRGKWYTYRFHNAPHASALYRNTRTHVPLPLDDALMNAAAQRLVGTHDFAAFAAQGGSAKTTVRTIHEIHVTRQGELVSLTVYGNAFLYNMVRIIAGTLIEIGHHRLPPQCLTEAIETGNRLCLGPTAPPNGLELTKVLYDE